LTADARVLINRARVECQSYKLTVEDPVTVEYITKWIGQKQQKMTQSGGVRPYGLSTLIVGFDHDGTPRLYQTDPSGIYSEWVANAVGRNSKSVKEYLEKRYPGIRRKQDEDEDKQKQAEEEEVLDIESFDEKATVKLTISALLEVVESPKNIEIATMTRENNLVFMDKKEIEEIVEAVEKEKKDKKEKKRSHVNDYFVVFAKQKILINSLKP